MPVKFGDSRCAFVLFWQGDLIAGKLRSSQYLPKAVHPHDARHVSPRCRLWFLPFGSRCSAKLQFMPPTDWRHTGTLLFTQLFMNSLGRFRTFWVQQCVYVHYIYIQKETIHTYIHTYFIMNVFAPYPVLLQETRVPSFDKQQRDFLKLLPPVTFLEMILPYVRKTVEACVVKVSDKNGCS